MRARHLHLLSSGVQTLRQSPQMAHLRSPHHPLLSNSALMVPQLPQVARMRPHLLPLLLNGVKMQRKGKVTKEGESV